MFPKSWIAATQAIEFQSEISAPANIAWVKYWGKKGHQLPANPSLSLTLKESVTHTKLMATPADHLKVELIFEGNTSDAFGKKIENYLAALAKDLPLLGRYHYKIESRNTFPHSSGIASSASSQAALAMLLGRLLSKAAGSELDMKAVGSLARLGSGSACRSLMGGFVSWGETEKLMGASDLFATEVHDVHANFKQTRDCILIVSSKEKEVSSRQGHSHMKAHPYAVARTEQANLHYSETLSALKSGDWQKAGDIMEADALALHALMMTGSPGFILLEPGSLEIIRLVRLFREASKVPVYFTIDAGPNIHLIYPEEAHVKVEAFVRHELLRLTEKGTGVIWDRLGSGPV
jgi:diphosphomevalonate decarboxylase